MGAALTYARRYALFTLVGIAGEDDLDAPDLGAPHAEPKLNGRGDKKSADADADADAANNEPARSVPPRSKKAHALASSNPILDADQSAKLRDALITEIERLDLANDATIWARRSLKAKNTLTADDANAVERAFADRLAAFDQTISEQSDRTPRPEVASRPETVSRSGHETRPVLQKVIRLRDKEHRKFVARQPCIICGRTPSLDFSRSRKDITTRRNF